MRTTIATSFVLFALSAFAVPAAAQVAAGDHVVELNLMSWKPTPGIVLSTDSLTAATGIDAVDFVQEFGIEDSAFADFRLTAGRNHKFRLGRVNINYAADTIVEQTITFRGQTFNIGVPATGDINWDLWRFGYEWDFLRLDRGFLGVVAELKYNKIEASIDSPALTEAATTNPTAPVPTFGFAGRVYPHPMVSVGGEFTGISLSLDQVDASFSDFDINGGVYFGRHFGLLGGYRSVVVDYVVDSDRGNIDMKGPYFGASVKF